MIWDKKLTARIVAMEAEVSRLNEEVRSLRPAQIMTASLEFTDGNNELSGVKEYNVAFSVSEVERRMLRPLTFNAGKYLRAINAVLATFEDGRVFCGGISPSPEFISETTEFVVNEFTIKIDPNRGRRGS